MRSRIILALAVAGLMALGSVYAAQSAEAVKAKIDFAFAAGGKVLPAGEYEFQKDDAAYVFRIQGQGKTGDIVNIVTSLTRDLHAEPQAASLVFDVVGNKYILSEIWIPGYDGYLVQATKGRHTHKIVKVS
ncbi:MAG: hypothetical protein ABFD52_08035 [Acidobacteriota bacterium]